MEPMTSFSMDPRQLSCLAGYLVFILIAGALALARLWKKGSPSKLPHSTSASQKAPLYLAINLMILFAIWCPRDWPVFIPLLALIGGFSSWELVRPLATLGSKRFVFPALTIGLVFLAQFLPPVVMVRAWLGLSAILVALNRLARPDGWLS